MDARLMKSQRAQFLKRLWEIAGGNTSFPVAVAPLVAELGFDIATQRAVRGYLLDAKLVRVPGVAFGGGNNLCITNEGVLAVEADEAPEAVPDSPPVLVIVGQMENSQLQVATQGSVEVGGTAAPKEQK